MNDWHLRFFDQCVLSASNDKVKQSVKKSDISGLPNGNTNKSLSIFSALDKNHDGELDNTEIQSAFSEMITKSNSDRSKEDISIEEMQSYISSLKDENNNPLDTKGIKPIDMFNFVNEHLLIKKNEAPRYIHILEMISGDKGFEDNVATHALQNLDRYEDLLSDYTNENNYAVKEPPNETVKDMQAVLQDYFEEYGTELSSSSRESLLTNDISEETSEKYSRIRNGKSVKTKDDWQNLKERIKENKFANCGECQMMVLDILHEKYGDKYKYSAIDIKCKIKDTRCAMGYETHCAVLLTDENNNEYVIDPWLNPRDGGIFERADWEKLVTDIYRTDEYKIKLDEETLESITRETIPQ